jgi:hypothetical protein
VVWPQNNYDSFLVWALKPRSMVCWFDHKTTATVWWFGTQNHYDSFLVWTSKRMGGRLSVCASKPMSGWGWCEDTRRHPVACFFTKQVGLGFPSFASKLAKVQWRMVHVASSRRSCGSEAKDGRFDGVGCGAAKVGPNYPSLVIVFFLDHRGILVFCFCYK